MHLDFINEFNKSIIEIWYTLLNIMVTLFNNRNGITVFFLFFINKQIYYIDSESLEVDIKLC